jgi:hypothetical protein
MPTYSLRLKQVTTNRNLIDRRDYFDHFHKIIATDNNLYQIHNYIYIKAIKMPFYFHIFLCIFHVASSYSLGHISSSLIHSSLNLRSIRWKALNIATKSSLVLSKMSYDDDNNVDDGYTTKQLLKAETEDPFIKLRLFLYAGFIASACIGTLTTLPSLIAVYSGIRSGDLNTLATNLAINIGGVVVLSILAKRDLDSQEKRLQRIQKGGKLAGLKLKISANDDKSLICKVSDLRRDRGMEKRVVIVAAPPALLEASIQSSIPQKVSLVANDLLVVPLVIEQTEQDKQYNDYRLTTNNVDEM